MRRYVTCIVVTLLLALCVGGCSGLIANATYSQLIDKTAALSDETLGRWPVLDANQQRAAFAGQNAVLHRIQDAKNGKP